MQPIALLLDFDGVLRRWKGDDASIETRCGLPAGAIRRLAFSPEFLTPAITGAMADRIWRDQVADELQRRYPRSSAREALAQWSAPVGEIDPAVLGILSRCRPDLRLVLATNATSRLAVDLHKLGLADRFYALANSSELGVTKPSIVYFEAALARAGVRVSDALFVDDSSLNVEVASAIGIRSHHFTGAVALSVFLYEAGALAESALLPVSGVCVHANTVAGEGFSTKN